jgi:hypothetical protein
VSRVFTFPVVVNEAAVRVTAAGVAVLAAAAVVTRWPALLVVLAYGFCARTAAGPRLSPLALLATRVVAPRLPGPLRLVPGPPKRFAQGIGAVVSLTAVLFAYVVHQPTAAFGLAAMMAVLAFLEAGFRLCVGCLIHARLVRAGVIRSVECADCADISLRRAPAHDIVAVQELAVQEAAAPKQVRS